ncbi:hypothetical protein MTP99_000824 [Tenebrio molitor]|jgi:hypothetical protein|nr:hypothetical protein MTP99_000824 [Tenebrio molitor]
METDPAFDKNREHNANKPTPKEMGLTDASMGLCQHRCSHSWSVRAESGRRDASTQELPLQVVRSRLAVLILEVEEDGGAAGPASPDCDCPGPA